MSDALTILWRELIYVAYYFDVQLRQIFWFWVLGMAIGTFVSVFLKERIHGTVRSLGARVPGGVGLVLASALGILSPLCMYGTIPIAASFSKSGVRDDWLAAFMTSSVLLNPQLIVYSMALGKTALIVRVVSCFLCGALAGALVRVFYRETSFFTFEGFSEPKNRDTDPNIVMRLLRNFGRNLRATGLYFLLGVLLSALFRRYVPDTIMTAVFGGNHLWGVLMAATVGVPLYACGGGTIPLLQEWIGSGMSLGSAAAFMITGPATKITNLGALKIVLGARRFGLYLAYTMAFSLLCGVLVNLLVAHAS